MRTAALQVPAQTCPAWCTPDGHDFTGTGMHFGDVHEAGDLTLCLAQAPGEATPTIGLNDDMDQELTLSLDEAERLGTLLLQLARQGRTTAARAA